MRALSRLVLSLSLLLCAACQPWGTTPQTSEEEEELLRPAVPLPAVDTEFAESTAATRDLRRLERLPLPRRDRLAEVYFSDILTHPWIEKQPGVRTLTREIVDDLELLQRAHAQLTEQRREAGLDTPSFQQELNLIISSIEELQTPLERLRLEWPLEFYSVLNIPTASPHLVPPPVPYQIHKRVHLFTATEGFPTFLDARVFPLRNFGDDRARHQALLQLIEWHLSALKGGSRRFNRYISPDCIAFVGSGDHNTDVSNPGHGLATRDRLIFVGFLPTTDRVDVLYADGPRSEMEPLVPTLLGILNRPLIESPRPEPAQRQPVEQNRSS